MIQTKAAHNIEISLVGWQGVFFASLGLEANRENERLRERERNSCDVQWTI